MRGPSVHGICTRSRELGFDGSQHLQMNVRASWPRESECTESAARSVLPVPPPSPALRKNPLWVGSRNPFVKTGIRSIRLSAAFSEIIDLAARLFGAHQSWTSKCFCDNHSRSERLPQCEISSRLRCSPEVVEKIQPSSNPVRIMRILSAGMLASQGDNRRARSAKLPGCAPAFDKEFHVLDFDANAGRFICPELRWTRPAKPRIHGGKRPCGRLCMLVDGKSGASPCSFCRGRSFSDSHALLVLHHKRSISE